jgi:hypothetical protein
MPNFIEIAPFPPGQAEDSFGYKRKQVPNSSRSGHSVQLTALATYDPFRAPAQSAIGLSRPLAGACAVQIL